MYIVAEDWYIGETQDDSRGSFDTYWYIIVRTCAFMNQTEANGDGLS